MSDFGNRLGLYCQSAVSRDMAWLLKRAASLGIDNIPSGKAGLCDVLAKVEILHASPIRAQNIPNMTVPDYMLDPVTAELLLDPYVAEDDRTYNLPTLRDMSEQGLLSGPFLRNRALHSVVMEFLVAAGLGHYVPLMTGVSRNPVITADMLRHRYEMLDVVAARPPLWYKHGINEARPFGTPEELISILRTSPGYTIFGLVPASVSSTRHSVMLLGETVLLQKVMQAGSGISLLGQDTIPLQSLPAALGYSQGFYWPCKMSGQEAEHLWRKYPNFQVEVEGITIGSGLPLKTQFLLTPNYWDWLLPVAAVLLDFAIFSL